MQQRKKNLREICADSFRVIHSLDKWKIPILLLKNALTAAVPFIAILLSAELLNRLLDGGEYRPVLLFALINVGVIFVLTVFGALAKKSDDTRFEYCCRRYGLKKSETLMAMDFASLESPALSALRTKLHTEENMGFGVPLLMKLQDLLSKHIFTALFSLILLIPAVAGSGGTAGWGTLLFLTVSGALSYGAALLNKRATDGSMRMIKTHNPPELVISEYMADMGGVDYTDGKDIRIYGFQGTIRNCFETAFTQMKSFTKVCATVPALALGVSGIVKALIMGGSYLFAAILSRNGDLELGTVILFSGLLFQFAQAVTSAAMNVSIYISASESLQTFLDFTSLPTANPGGNRRVETRDEHTLEFRNVSFRYPGSQADTLKRLSLRIEPGKRLAIVGMNGSGKTTMIKLLCRLYDPTEGDILLDDVDIRQYDRNEYANLLSVVFQDFRLFSLELGQVLAALPEYDAARAADCLAKSGFRERLAKMPAGVQTTLYKDFDDGVEISGGEAQKIALARALYKDAPFLILDEPTAALDPVSEYEIYAAMNELAGNKTAVFISHRLSSCRFCDDIAVFHEGELIQRGNHETLLANETGMYHELWNAQARHYC